MLTICLVNTGSGLALAESTDVSGSLPLARQRQPL